jgi:hypothetical protein
MDVSLAALPQSRSAVLSFSSRINLPVFQAERQSAGAREASNSDVRKSRV